MLFVRNSQVHEELECSIDDRRWWDEIADVLYDSDMVAIQRKDGKPISKTQARFILWQLIENIEDNGEPLIWRIENDVIFAGLDHDSETFGERLFKQCLEFIPEKNLKELWGTEYDERARQFAGGFKAPPQWRKYEFNGALEAVKKIRTRPRIENLLDEVRNAVPPNFEALRKKTELMSLEETLMGRPFGRSEDLTEFANYLYDSYQEALEIKPEESEAFSLTEISDEVEESLSSFGISSTTLIAKVVKQTPKANDEYIEWQKRVLVELSEDPRVLKTPIVDSMIIELFEAIQLNYPCIWCGRDDVDLDHQGRCESKGKLLSAFMNQPVPDESNRDLNSSKP
jgi:hypothetical protein